MEAPDPIIQDPEHSQSYNRYTYVWNNPTNLTDPTGFEAATATVTMRGDDGLTTVNHLTMLEEGQSCQAGTVCIQDTAGNTWQNTSTTVSNEQGQSTSIDWTGGQSNATSTNSTGFSNGELKSNGTLNVSAINSPAPPSPGNASLGKSQAGEVKSLEAELEKMPPYVLKYLRANGIRWAVVKDSVVEEFPELKGVRAGGRTDTWDTVPGIYRAQTKTVAFAFGGKFAANQGSFDLFLHETGHAAEDVSSGRDSIKSARAKDFNSLRSYYQQGYPNGYQETFAEGFARFYGGDKSMKTNWPNIFEYFKHWDKCIKTAGKPDC